MISRNVLPFTGLVIAVGLGAVGIALIAAGPSPVTHTLAAAALPTPSPVADPSPAPPGDLDSPAPPLRVQPSPLTGPWRGVGDPSALPGYLLISDRGNSRVIELDPFGRIVWEFPPPNNHGAIAFDQNDDAFYAPDGVHISTNEEFEQTVQVIDRSTGQVSWRYGTPFRAGSGPNQLNGPDDAYLLPDGRLITADIKNCRVLAISPDDHSTQIGHTGVCRHDPAHGYLASPNGDAPSADHRFLVVTEIGGSWVDVFTLPDFRYQYSFHSPAGYPSDAIMQPDGTFLLTDYGSPGAVYRVDQHGHVLWRYATALDHPSIAIGLPNGLICISDDYGDRVLIVDPATGRVRWQYGVRYSPGRSSGHLYIPDGLDFRAA